RSPRPCRLSSSPSTRNSWASIAKAPATLSFLPTGTASRPTQWSGPNEIDDLAAAFQNYQATRLERTARVQLTSRPNTWGEQPEHTSWVSGYDAWPTPLVRPQLRAAG